MTLDLIAFQKALNEENINDMLDFIKHSPYKHRFHEYFNKNGDMAFHIVAKKGKPEDLEIIKAAQNNAMAAIDRRNNKGQTGLHLACERAELNMVKAFIAYQASITIFDYDKTLPIHIAAFKNSVEIAALLCEEGLLRNKAKEKSFLPRFLQEYTFDIDAKNKSHQSPYRIARGNNFQSMMSVLAKVGGQDYFEDAKNCLYQGDIKGFEKLIDDYPNILKDQDESGNTLIHHLIWNQNSESKRLIEKMVHKGVDINVVNDEGKTPLHCLAQVGFQHGQGEMLLNLLITLGAKVDQSCNKGLSALHYAAYHNHIDAIDYLISNGADFEKVSCDGFRPLHMAVLKNSIQAFKHLVEKYKVNINALTYKSASNVLAEIEKPIELSVLWIAVYKKNREIVEYIVDHQISQNNAAALDSIRLQHGDTLVHYFVSLNSWNYYLKLFYSGCNPYIPNEQGLTPLHVAASKGYLHLVNYLVGGAQKPGRFERLFSYTFDIDSVTKEGKSAWVLADENHHTRITKYLELRGAKVKAKITHPKGLVERYKDEQKYGQELEKTTGYQIANIFSMALPTISSAVLLGPMGAASTLGTQVGLYAAPQLRERFGATVYYRPKRFLHNHVHWSAEKTWDVLSYFPGFGLWALNMNDWINNPMRRVAGTVSSHAFAHGSELFTDNRQVHGAMYVFGRQLGYAAVDAYKEYAQTSESPDAMRELSEQQTIQSLRVWCSLLGKEQGEQFINAMNSVAGLRNSIYQTVGGIEHMLLGGAANLVKQTLEGIDGYQALMKGLDSVNELVSSYDSYFTGPQAIYAAAKSQINFVIDLRDRAFFSIEKTLHENLIPESEYKQYAIGYLLKTKAGLIGHKLQEQENAEKAAQTQHDAAKAMVEQLMDSPPSNDGEFIQAMRRYEAAKDMLCECKINTQTTKAAFEQCQQQYEKIWEKTPIGVLELNLKNAQIDEATARLEVESISATLEYLEQQGLDAQKKSDYEAKLLDAKNALATSQSNLRTHEVEIHKVLTSFESAHLQKREKSRVEALEKQVAEHRQNTLAYLNDASLYDQLLSNLVIAQASLYNAQASISDLEVQLEHVDKILYSLAHPGSINLDHTVSEALSSRYDALSVADFIISRVVATGVISTLDAQQRMRGVLSSAFLSSNRHNEIYKALANQMVMLNEDYKYNFLVHQKDLQTKIQSAKDNYNQLQQNEFKAQQQVSEQRSKLESYLSAEQRVVFTNTQAQIQQQMSAQFWQEQHPDEDVKTLISLVGQPEFADFYAHTENHLYSPASMANFKPETVAKWLVEYKYLFLSSSIEDKFKETNSLATQFKQEGLSVEKIAQAKNNIDVAIGKGLLQSGFTAKELANRVQQGLGFNSTEAPEGMLVEGVLLQESLSVQLAQNDKAGALATIQSTLSSYAKQVSIEKFGEWSARAYPTNEGMAYTGTNDRHGLSKLFHHPLSTLAEVAKDILANGVSVQTTGKDVNVGLTNQNMFQVFQKNKPSQPLFEIYKTPLSYDPVTNPKPLGVPLSSKPLPSVLPQGSWQPSVVPYMQASEFRVVPTSAPVMKAPEPVLPLATYLPSLSQPSQTYLPLMANAAGALQPSAESSLAEVPVGTTRSGACYRPREPEPILSVDELGLPTESLASKVGNAALSLLVKDAHANPAALMVEGAVMTGVAPGAAAANSQRHDGFDEPWDQSTTLPVHVEDLSRFFGNDGDDRIRLTSDTSTLVDQPKTRLDPYSTPLGVKSGILLTQGILNLYRKADDKLSERLYKPDPDKKYIQKPKVLPGFPEAKKAQGKTPYAGGIRQRWTLPKGIILEWDSQHGELEMYDKKGNHLGAFNHNTGEQIKPKNNDRKITKFI